MVWTAGVCGASVALETVREYGGDPIARWNTLGSKGSEGGVRRAGVATSAKTLDREFGPLVTMGQETVDAVALPLLDHRGESLEAKTSLPDRLIEVFGLGSASIFLLAES